MLGVIDLEVDMLVGDMACAIHGKQESLIKIGIEISLFGRSALVELEREDHGDVHLVLQSFIHKVFIQLIDAGLVIVLQLIERNSGHLTCHALTEGLGQREGLTFLYLLQIGVCGL